MKVNKKKVGAILMMAAGAGLIANAVYIKKKVEIVSMIILIKRVVLSGNIFMII